MGVSLTGIMDNKLTSTNDPILADMLDKLREYAVEVNKEWAEKLGINQSGRRHVREAQRHGKPACQLLARHPYALQRVPPAGHPRGPQESQSACF